MPARARWLSKWRGAGGGGGGEKKHTITLPPRPSPPTTRHEKDPSSGSEEAGSRRRGRVSFEAGDDRINELLVDGASEAGILLVQGCETRRVPVDPLLTTRAVRPVAAVPVDDFVAMGSGEHGAHHVGLHTQEMRRMVAGFDGWGRRRTAVRSWRRLVY